jgi:7-keto-8-aminopelargonate synthetase-like enzyme
MVQFEAQQAAQRAILELRARGAYCCLSTFPAVPMDKPSLRFTVSRHNSVADIREFVAELAEVVADRAEAQSSAYAS